MTQADITTTELEEFDQGWLEVIRQTPWIKDLYALVGLTRLGERAVALERLATVVDRPLEETAAMIQREFKTRIEGGMVHWDDPYPGEHSMRSMPTSVAFSRSLPPPRRPNRGWPPAPEAAPSPSRRCSNGPGTPISATAFGHGSTPPPAAELAI